MKLCDNCGAINSDERIFCVDCNEKLGDRLSEKQETDLERQIANATEKAYNRSDPLYVSLFDKIIGFACLVGLFLLIIAFVLSAIKETDVSFMWYGLIFFVYGIIVSFFPAALWELDKLRLSFMITDSENAEPSLFYRACRKISELISVIVGFVVLGGMIFLFLKGNIMQ